MWGTKRVFVEISYTFIYYHSEGGVFTDINELIETVILKTKTSENEYRDEPIIRTAADMIKFTPPKYREMRLLAKYNFDNESDKTFYEQGKFMEDYEDDFDYNGDYSRYYPTYQTMNDRQLRGYFSWRTKVRKGDITQTSLSFAFIYIYEILNQIGVETPEEGFWTLKKFWNVYKEFDFRVDRYLKLWLADYIVYYNLDKALFNEIPDMNFNNEVVVLLNYSDHTSDEIFNALISLSTYNLQNSKFFKQYPDDVKNVVVNVYGRLFEYYEKNRKIGICEKFFGKVLISPYNMFNSAVFYDRNNKNFEYEINQVTKFISRNGNWTCKRFLCYKDKNKKTGELLKAIDSLMRQKYNFKSYLKAETIKLYQDIINEETDKYQEAKRKAALPKIEIDISKLQDIRNTSIETQNKLIVEESVEDLPQIAPVEEKQTNTLNLSDVEYSFIKCLLNKAPYNDLLKTRGIMLSVIVDSINEKLFDLFNDTVIIYEEDKPVVIEDYLDELKGKTEK